MWLQVLIMSAYTGVVFFRVKNDPEQIVMNLKRGVFFISVLNMTLINLGQLPTLLEERAIYYKQQGAHFFRPQSFLFAKIIGSLPFSLFEVELQLVYLIFSFMLTWPHLIFPILIRSLNLYRPNFDVIDWVRHAPYFTDANAYYVSSSLYFE